MTGGIPAHLSSPVLSARDRAVVELVGQLRQATAGQIGTVLFADNASKTPLNRVLQRLVEQRYLMRLGRLVGGDGGGAQQYTYQLGRKGWRLLGKEGAYWQPRAVNLHTKMVADCFVQLVTAERAGLLALLGYKPEPECHIEIGGIRLTPDVYVELGFQQYRRRMNVYVEADRGTEHRATIQEKCVRYWKVYQRWELPVFPYVVFVVLDGERAAELANIVAGGPPEAQELFIVSVLGSFPRALAEMVKSGVESVDPVE